MIDWTLVVRSINCAGMSQREIAAAVDMSFSSVQKIAMGLHSQPRKFESCHRLLDLHLDMCPDRHKPEVIGAP